MDHKQQAAQSPVLSKHTLRARSCNAAPARTFGEESRWKMSLRVRPVLVTTSVVGARFLGAIANGGGSTAGRRARGHGFPPARISHEHVIPRSTSVFPKEEEEFEEVAWLRTGGKLASHNQGVQDGMRAGAPVHV